MIACVWGQTQDSACGIERDSISRLIAPYIVPRENDALVHPTLRHPDLQPNYVFVSDDVEITGLIDGQHCAILPVFL